MPLSELGAVGNLTSLLVSNVWIMGLGPPPKLLTLEPTISSTSPASSLSKCWLWTGSTFGPNMSFKLRCWYLSSFSRIFFHSHSGWGTLGTGLTTYNSWLRKIWLIRSSSEILRAELPYFEDWLLKSESKCTKKRGHYSMEKESVISFTFCMAAGIVIIFWIAELRRWR